MYFDDFKFDSFIGFVGLGLWLLLVFKFLLFIEAVDGFFCRFDYLISIFDSLIGWGWGWTYGYFWILDYVNFGNEGYLFNVGSVILLLEPWLSCDLFKLFYGFF